MPRLTRTTARRCLVQLSPCGGSDLSRLGRGAAETIGIKRVRPELRSRAVIVINVVKSDRGRNLAIYWRSFVAEGTIGQMEKLRRWPSEGESAMMSYVRAQSVRCSVPQARSYLDWIELIPIDLSRPPPMFPDAL